MKLSKDARISIGAMTSAEKKECLAAAKKLYRLSLMTPKRFNTLSKYLQR